MAKSKKNEIQIEESIVENKIVEELVPEKFEDIQVIPELNIPDENIQEVPEELKEELIEQDTEAISQIVDEKIMSVLENFRAEKDEETIPEVLNIGAPTEIPVELVKPKRTLDSLSKDEFRTYQRTGRIPE
jgi:hypothetical protein